MRPKIFEIVRCKPKIIKFQKTISITIAFNDWYEYVQNGSELIWFDSTKIGTEFYNSFGKNKLKNRTAYYNYLPESNTMEFEISWYEEGYLQVNLFKKTKKGVDILKSIAVYFNANFYDLTKKIAL